MQHMGTGLNPRSRPASIIAALLALTLATVARADGAFDTRAAFLAVIERPHVAAKAATVQMISELIR